jgi:hypothetical protein
MGKLIVGLTRFLLLYVAVLAIPVAASAQQSCWLSVEADSYNCTIWSTAGWQQTSLSLQQGDQFKISYLYGAWTVGYPGLSFVGPAGYTLSGHR